MPDLSVGFVVNSVDETSVPADIAQALVKYTDCSVGILAWFNSKTFDGDSNLDITCLNAPDTVLGINRSVLSRARNELQGYDLVQVHHNHSGGFAKLLARSIGIPVVSREGNLRRGFTREGRVFNGVTNGLATRIVPNSIAVRDSFKRWEDALIDGDDIRIIPNGVDAERLKAGKSLDWDVRPSNGIASDAILISTAGLLTEQKAHEILISALAKAAQQTDEHLVLAIAGDGPREAALRTLAEQEDVIDQVQFLGRLKRKQVYRLLYESDIYAMPSRWEGFSAAAVEAMGVGVPCVFSDISPFSVPYEDVALFHPVDDTDILASRLVELAEDPEMRKNLATDGQELVNKHYTMESVARQYRDLYMEILE